jgi:DNA gyrase/topoisomerase IV subunit B
VLGKGKLLFIVEEIVSTIRNNGVYVGEQDADEIYDALLNPETRHVEQLQIVDKDATANLIECLLGPSVPPRREYLLKHSEEANDND